MGMMHLKSINVNKSSIVTETQNATVIKMPKKSLYKGFSFWHTNKLIGYGRNRNSIAIEYFEGFIFTLKKYGNGRYNKFKIMSEIEISSEEFEEAFCIVDKNIKEKTIKVRKIPKLTTPNVSIIPDLKDY